jgi:hypothetical protein
LDNIGPETPKIVCPTCSGTEHRRITDQHLSRERTRARLQERVEARSAALRERVGRRRQINLLPDENVHPLS